MQWYRALDGQQRTTFWSCFGGWALDAMDVQMYALVIPTLMAEWGLTRASAGTLGSAALLASSVGGVGAGLLADRIGRVRVLQICVLWFSMFTFLAGFAQDYGQLLAARTLQGLGFGGEWAAGAVLMAEMIPPERRGRTLAAVASGWSVGYAAAALLFAALFAVLPAHTAWRALFLLGVTPALLVLVIRRRVPESPLYLAQRVRTGSSLAAVAPLLQTGIRTRVAIAWAVCLGVLGGNYTVLTWLPTLLQSEHGISYASTGMVLLVNIAGSFVGYHIGGAVSDGLGRRRALQLFALTGALSVAGFIGWGDDRLALVLLGFPLGFAQSALNAGLAPLLSELFPTGVRATAQGFCYNAGRGCGAVFPLLVGIGADRLGLTASVCFAAGAAYALVAFCTLALPETRHIRLSDIR